MRKSNSQKQNQLAKHTMGKTFFEELNNESITGVAYKNVGLKKNVLSYFANTGNATIADLCKELNLSAPKITTLLGDLTQDGLIKDYGKIESTGGRKPNLYGLVPESAFFIGVDIKHNHINIGLSDLQKNLIKVSEKIPYKLENHKASLDALCMLINKFIEDLSTPKEKILGIGINLSGRINYTTGHSYNFFHFSEEPLTKVIESKIGIRIFLENDSNSMAYGEFSAGVVTNEKNILFLNLDLGIGLGIIINGQLYYGKSGYSGEFGHIPLFDNELICNCGKKGCLETQASGRALIRMFKERISEGSSSILTRQYADLDDLKMEDIIAASANDDVLAIELIAKIGENLGRGTALLINLFNPELVVLGGSLAATSEYILLPIKTAIHKYSLSLVNQDTVIMTSNLGERAGLIGACLLVRNHVLSLN